MNPSHQTHPSREQLTAFTAGKLNAVESDEIEQHLSGCDSCCHLLTDLPDEDTLTGLLRDDTSVSPDETDSFAQTIVHAPKASTNAPHDQATLLPEGDTAGPPLDLPPELREHARYRIVRLLGRGGMGDVYEAEHKVMNRPVALKVIKPSLVRNDAAVRRFRREVQAAARLRHPNIVTAFDAEQAGDLHYLVMEFVDGVDLDDVIREQGPLPVEAACDYIRQTAEGLQHAHELGMVHRDIKPHNLMIEEPHGTLMGSAKTVKILDFGLANFASETAAEEIDVAEDQTRPGAEVLNHLTQAGTMMGTPDYIAPEQAKDAHNADIRSDIYSLGCTFYTLLTGKTPFSEGSVLEKIKAHTEADAQPLSEFRDDVPEEVEAVLNKMMAKDPEERYQTPREVAEALNSFSRESATKSPRRKALTKRILALLATAAVILLGVVIYLATDTGELEIAVDEPPIPGAKIVLLKDGKEYATFDLTPGKEEQRIRSGDYTIKLIEAPPNVDLNIWSKRSDSKDWGAPKHAGSTVAVSRGSGLMIEVLRREPLAKSFPKQSSKLPLTETGDPDLDGVLKDALAVYTFEEETFYREQGRMRVRDVSGNGHDASIEDDRKAYAAEGRVGGGLACNRSITGFAPKGLPGSGIKAGDQNMYETPLPKLRLPEAFLLGREEYTVTLWIRDAGKATTPIGKSVRMFFQEGFPRGNDAVYPLTVSFVEQRLRAMCLGELIDPSYKNADAFPPEEILPKDEWFFLALTLVKKDGEQTLRITLNDKTFEQPFAAIPRKPEGGFGLIGGIDGTIDELAFFGRALTDEEVEKLRQIGLENKPLHSSTKRTTPLPTFDGKALELLRQIPRHQRHVQAVAWSPDGRFAVTAGITGRVLLWNTEQWSLLGEFPDHTKGVTCLAVSPDSQFVASGDAAGVVMLWNVEERKRLHVLTGHEKLVTDVTFSRDGRHLLTVANDMTLRRWNIATGKQVDLLNTQGQAETIVELPDESVITSGQSIERWNIANERRSTTFPIGRTRIYSSIITPDGSRLATGDVEGVIRIHDIERGVLLHEVDFADGHVESLAATADGRLLIVGSLDRMLGLVEVETGKVVLRHRTQSHCVNFITLSPDGRHVLSGGGHFFDNGKYTSDGDYDLRLWRLPESVWPKQTTQNEITLLKKLKRSTNNIDSLAYSPDGRFLFVGSAEKVLYQWDLAKETIVRQIPVGDFPRSLAVHPDGKHIFTGGYEGGVVMWSLDGGRPVQEFDGHAKSVESLAVSPNGKRLLSASPDGFARLWDVETAKILQEFSETYSHGAALSSDGGLAAHTMGSGIRIWETESGKPLHELQTQNASPISALAFSPDGEVLVSGDYKGRIQVWDVKTGRELHRFDKQTDRIASIAFTPDGRHFLAGSWDRSLKIFDLHRGLESHVINAETLCVSYLAISPDGKTLATAGGMRFERVDGKHQTIKDDDYDIHLWRLPESVWPAPQPADKLEAKYQQSIKKGLNYLAKIQHEDGHWEAENPKESAGAYPVAMTALAGMTMLMEGSTLEYGLYSDNLRRAVSWLMAQSQDDGRIAFPLENNYRYMFGHGYAMLFLSSVYAQEEDGPRKRKLKEILTKAVDLTAKAKTSRGGWGYVTAAEGNNFDEAATSIVQLQSLRAARNAGIHIPRGLIDAEYLRKFTGPKGGVLYMVDAKTPMERPALTAAALAGCEYDKELFKKWLEFTQKNLRLDGQSWLGHRDYSNYYYAQALYILGDDGYGKLFPESKPADRLTWSKYREAAFDGIIARQEANGSWSDNQIGPVYGTVCSLTVLQLDNDVVPIYRRAPANN
jgi:WD40 repeat protein/serine/threonine protein kinase